jgi:hypothetical protein
MSSFCKRGPHPLDILAGFVGEGLIMLLCRSMPVGFRRRQVTGSQPSCVALTVHSNLERTRSPYVTNAAGDGRAQRFGPAPPWRICRLSKGPARYNPAITPSMTRRWH